MSRILVTGATGTNGRWVVQNLISNGAIAVAGVRDFEKAKYLQDMGAELVYLDFEFPESIDEAFQNVERAVLILPYAPNFDELTEMCVDAAKKAGVSFLVHFSGCNGDINSEVELMARYGRSDKCVQESGIPCCILQPNFFMENLINYEVESIRQYNCWSGAAGEGKTAYISVRDIVHTIVTILLNPEKYTGKTYYLAGREAISEPEVAQLISEAVDREVTYVNYSIEDYEEAIASRGFPEWTVQDFVGLERSRRDGTTAQVTDVVKEITGEDALTFKEWIQENASAFM